MLDQIWTNNQLESSNAYILVDLLADHLPVMVCFSLGDKSHKKTLTTKKRHFSLKNKALFQQKISNINVLKVTKFEDVNEAFELFMAEIKPIFDECFPLVAVKLRDDKNEWYDDELKELENKKNYLYKRYLVNKTVHAKSNYHKIRNKYFHLFKQKKQNYYPHLLLKHKCCIKNTWKVINTLLGKSKIAFCNDIVIDGKHSGTKQEAANCFNKHFASVAQKLMNNLPSPSTPFSHYLKDQRRTSLYFYATTPKEIKNTIMNMKSNISSGLDEIPSAVLKLFDENVLWGLSPIFYLSLSQVKFIERLKVAEIVPVYKKDKKTDVNNYRPISLLFVFSKVLEKLVYKRLYSYLSKQNFLNQAQFGFRKHTSTAQAAALLEEKIANVFEG